MIRANLKNYIIYLDVSKLYRSAMRLSRPKSGFKQKCVMHTEGQIMKMEEQSKKGWIVELNLEHDAQNNYPLATEKKVVKIEQMSGYQKRLMAE